MKKPGTARKKTTVDTTAEEKIKEAARKVFTQKGYAAARTRDIANEAGINLALLNYYFRSKEKLFDLIMFETIQQFMGGVKVILMDEETTLTQKTERIVVNYIDMLKVHPDLPLFIFSELRSEPEKLVERMGVKEFIFQSSYFRQLREAAKGNGRPMNPIHFFINTLSLVIFPFLTSPILINVTEMKPEQFEALMEERKKLIPVWIEAMLKA